MSESEYWVYALYSLKTKQLYIGMSSNIERRLKEHNTGQVKSTCTKRPYKLIYKRSVGDRKSARFFEKKLKGGFGREFLTQFIPG